MCSDKKDCFLSVWFVFIIFSAGESLTGQTVLTVSSCFFFHTQKMKCSKKTKSLKKNILTKSRQKHLQEKQTVSTGLEVLLKLV